MPLSNGKIREKQYKDSHGLCNVVNEFLPHIFRSLLDKTQ